MRDAFRASTTAPWLLRPLLGSRREQLSAHRAALREPAVIVLLEKPRPEEVPALAEYWRNTGRAKSTARLLESFAAAGDDLRFLDIVHLLSPIERELLVTRQLLTLLRRHAPGQRTQRPSAVLHDGGAGLLTLLPELIGIFETYKDFVHGAILVSILMFLPQGLVTGLVDMVRMRLALRKREA